MGSSALLAGPFVPDLLSMLVLTSLKSAVGGAAGAFFGLVFKAFVCLFIFLDMFRIRCSLFVRFFIFSYAELFLSFSL